MMADMEPHVASVFESLVKRARSGLYRPGDRFMSNRAVVMRYGVSYQTAHRLLARMVGDGILQRTDRSGTFLAGYADRPNSVMLVFPTRAKTAGSFGAKLLASLRDALQTARLHHHVSFDEDAHVPAHQLPILWQVPQVLARCLRDHRRAILVHDRPAASLEANVIDSVASDDFAGGVMAAQYLRRAHSPTGAMAVIGGPKNDRRSQARIAGFLSETPASVVHAKDWYEPDGEASAGSVIHRKPHGVFCCNDRLAEGFLRACAARKLSPPPVVGFDDAPIATKLGLTTVAIPWDALAAAVVRLARERINGSDDPATHLVLFPRIVMRVAEA